MHVGGDVNAGAAGNVGLGRPGAAGNNVLAKRQAAKASASASADGGNIKRRRMVTSAGNPKEP